MLGTARIRREFAAAVATMLPPPEAKELNIRVDGLQLS
jgi:hypothetical protein